MSAKGKKENAEEKIVDFEESNTKNSDSIEIEKTVELTEMEELEQNIQELEDQVEKLTAEKTDKDDQLLRKSAEFDNFRRRLLRDKEDSIRYANTRLLTDLVDTMDNFERAIISGKETKDLDSFLNGIEIIENQLVSTLDSKYGLKRFDSKGEEFDPQKHEAVSMIASEEQSDNQMVLEELQKGYLLGDRVIRHSKVVVSQPVQ